MSNDIRTALKRLVKLDDAHEGDRTWEPWIKAIAAARAALAAEPVGEGPSDEELLESAAKALGYKSIPSDETCLTAEAGELIAFARAVLSRWARPATPPAPEPVGEGPTWEIVLQEDDCAPDAREYFDRGFRRFSGGLDVGSFKSLAQFKERDCGMTQLWLLGGVELSISADDPFYTVRKRNRPATPPAPEPGEVAELVAVLQVEARSQDICGTTTVITAAELRRAATLLQQPPAPAPVVVPVVVSERLPGEGDCDAAGRCWIFMPDIGTAPSWRLVDPRDIGPYHTHWLPAHAISLPQAGKVQQ